MRIPMVLISRPDRRKQAIEEARAAGLLGARRLPAAALMAEPDPSDTFVGELLTSFEAGQAEREKDAQP